jgi:ubiquinone/menaquinone biosynthesis C-methylase UbiE
MQDEASLWIGREMMAHSETVSLQEQAERLREWRSGFQAVYVIATGVQTGFFDQLAAQPQGLTAQELAQRTACHPPFVAIWCASAYHYYLLETVNGHYVLAPHVDSLLAGREHPDSQAAMFLSAVREAGPRLAKHADYMKSGAVGSHAEAYGTNPTRLDPPPNQEALQQRLWREEMQPRVPALDEALRHGGRVLDVGCGPGLMLLQLAAYYPTATFVGIDVVEVGGLETARRLIHARGFDERIRVERVTGEEIPYAGAFDGVLITRVFHEIPLALRAALFRACYRALKQPGVLLNLDFAYPDTLEEFREPLFWSGVNNQYREMSWGTVHPTWQEQHQMLTEAGFAALERHFVRHIPQGTHYLAVAHKR